MFPTLLEASCWDWKNSFYEETNGFLGPGSIYSDTKELLDVHCQVGLPTFVILLSAVILDTDFPKCGIVEKIGLKVIHPSINPTAIYSTHICSAQLFGDCVFTQETHQ